MIASNTSKHMKTINKIRANILTKVYQQPEEDPDPEDYVPDETYAVNTLTRKLLCGIYTCKEDGYCTNCCKNILPRHHTTIGVGPNLNSDFDNFIGAIDDNFEDGSCSTCNKSCLMERECGDFLFIEVGYHKFRLFLFIFVMIFT